MRLFVAVSSLLLAAPAFAQAGGGTTMTGSGASLTVNNSVDDSHEGASSHGGRNANGEKLICRRINNDSSSRLRGSRRVCYTEAQWRQIQHDNG